MVLKYLDGNFKYGVREGGTQVRYVVSLLDRTCSCNVWQLRGYPCRHAVTAIWKAMEHPEHYVHEWLTKDKYLQAYQFPLEPLNGPNEWPECSHNLQIFAPPVKIVKHRRTYKRKASAGELTGGIKMSKKGMQHKCSNCKQVGHKKTTCPMLPTQQNQPEVATQQSQTSIPMHNRGFGVYTCPNGYQRQAVQINTRGNQSLASSQVTTETSTQVHHSNTIRNLKIKIYKI
ncbi:uncharacterized protein LOC110710641 [Chenopodium quinoa]|uniref:uncharacterized protein LOC110710641 n=1 Tax=Chenopodium quinoa TaxID=63459 RepID=UPI000B793F99|nr:uncharacterized protein LOC110710641 [Chenopodium quinoa]